MSLLECPHTGVGLHNCVHFEDASVICSDGMKIMILRTYVKPSIHIHEWTHWI